MQIPLSSYVALDSPVHRLDARVKIALLGVYSAALFFIDTWPGMGVATLLFALAFACSHVPARRVFGLAAPVYVLVGFAVLFNAFVFATPDMIESAREGVAAGDLSCAIYPLLGGFSLTLPGLTRGAFYGARILLLVFATLVVSFSTTSTEMTRALNSFLSPLSKFHVPTDDIAMVFSIALRFIPVTAEEFFRVRDAQWSRGSRFGEGTLAERLSAWRTVFIPLFVGLFRRADALASAMDARCYGAGVHRTSHHDARLTPASVAVLIGGVAACCSLAFFL